MLTGKLHSLGVIFREVLCIKYIIVTRFIIFKKNGGCEAPQLLLLRGPCIVSFTFNRSCNKNRLDTENNCDKKQS